MLDLNRYSLPSMRELWSDVSKYKLWKQYEMFLAQVHRHDKLVRQLSSIKIDESSVARINILEMNLRHDVLAFLAYLDEQATDIADMRFLHHGVTSSDLVDTCLCQTLHMAGLDISAAVSKLLASIERRMLGEGNIVCLGRTHGQAADLTTYGHKFGNHFEAIRRSKAVFDGSVSAINLVKARGPVGNYSTISPDMEPQIAAMFAAYMPRITTQIINRSYFAHYFANLVVLVTCVENLAMEIRNLSRTEIGEVAEDFGIDQMGSSVMPHKRNPIRSENVCGLARTVRASLAPIMENIVQWHERDLAHSSTERMLFAQITTISHFLISRMAGIIDTLRIDQTNVQRNVYNHYVPSAQELATKVENGCDRQSAYRAVRDGDISSSSKLTNAQVIRNCAIDVEKLI